MPLDDHLLKNEQILASAQSVSGGFLHATNQRVIRYDKGTFNEKVESLSYSHIVAASYQRVSLLWVSVLGIFFIIFSVILYSLVHGILAPSGLQILSFLCLLESFLGLVLLFYGLFAKQQFYQIKAVGLSDTERQSWRTKGADSQARTFAMFIQDQIGNREQPNLMSAGPPPSPSPPPTLTREVITRETVGGRCEYCRSLMDDDAVFCQNCGAKR